MPSPQQQQNIANLKFLQSQLSAQQAGLPAFATPQGANLTPQQAAQAGAPVGMAAQFGGQPPPPQQPVQSQPQNRQQMLAQMRGNIQQALQKPSGGKAAFAALVTNVKNQPTQQTQLTTQQQTRLIAQEVARYFKGAAQQGSNFLSNLSTPGDIWFPIAVLFVLLFILVPVKGQDGNAHTRLMWLWMVLTRSAHVVGENTLPTPTASGVSYSNIFNPLTPNIPGSSARILPSSAQTTSPVGVGQGTVSGTNVTAYHPYSATGDNIV